MTDPYDNSILELQREYLAELPLQLDQIRADIEALRAGRAEAAGSLRARFHRLAGSGGSYGFPEISSIAREVERLIGTHPAASEAERLEEAVGRLAGIVRKARGSAPPALSPPGRSSVPGWCSPRGPSVIV